LPTYQAFNRRTGAWVKYHFAKGKGFEVIDVKQREPSIPFKNILKKGKGGIKTMAKKKAGKKKKK